MTNPPVIQRSITHTQPAVLPIALASQALGRSGYGGAMLLAILQKPHKKAASFIELHGISIMC